MTVTVKAMRRGRQWRPGWRRARSALITEGYRAEYGLAGDAAPVAIPPGMMKRLGRMRLMGKRFLWEMSQHIERRKRRARLEMEKAREAGKL